MPITDAEYEDAYAEALLCLADDGHVVGEPFRNGTETRYSIVDGRKLNDEAVLELWWESEITEEIIEGRSGPSGATPR
jgi:hypothetical protein